MTVQAQNNGPERFGWDGAVNANCLRDRAERSWSDSAATAECADQECDDREHEKDDADPKQPVNGCDEAAGEKQDDGDNGDDDEENVHRNSRPTFSQIKHTLRGVVCGYG
jgi:hypothetical protein